MEVVWKYIIIMLKDSLKYFQGGCIWAAGITVVVLAGMLIWRFALHKKVGTVEWFRLLPLFFLIVYIYCVLQLTVFSRKPGNYGGIDMRFLAKWDEWYGEKAYLISNIIMFLPLGILLPMMAKWTKHIILSLPVAALCSVGIEVVQLKYQLGFCQLDDVVANSVGFLIGFLVFLILYDVYQVVVFLYHRIILLIQKEGFEKS